MSALNLFSLNQEIKPLEPSKFSLEKDLQKLIENNMTDFFNVRFLKTEYQITEGRMDSIGIDEDNCPVILEYKRGENVNVIIQGLFYLDWLMDHKGDFYQLVLEKLGKDVADTINWNFPCVICVASEFNSYDLHAVNQIGRTVKLVRYRKYNDDLILFELLNSPNDKNYKIKNSYEPKGTQKTFEEQLNTASEDVKAIYKKVCDYIESLSEDISAFKLKYWLAYKKGQNVACITIQNTQVIIFLKLNPETVKLEENFSENVKGKGHLGTGDLKLILKNDSDFEKAKLLIEQACKIKQDDDEI